MDTLEEMKKERNPFNFLLFGLYDTPKKYSSDSWCIYVIYC